MGKFEEIEKAWIEGKINIFSYSREEISKTFGISQNYSRDCINRLRVKYRDSPIAQLFEIRIQYTDLKDRIIELDEAMVTRGTGVKKVGFRHKTFLRAIFLAMFLAGLINPVSYPRWAEGGFIGLVIMNIYRHWKVE